MVPRRLLVVADQAVSSATNFAAAFLAARSSDISGFGSIALAFSVYAICLGLSRGSVGETVALEVSSWPSPRFEFGAATGALMQLCLPLAILPLLCLLLAPSADALLFLMLAVSLPVLLVQDLSRLAAFGRERPGTALLSDGIWLAGLSLSVTLMGVTSGREVFTIWLLTCIPAAVAGLIALRPERVSRTDITAWRATHRARARTFTSDFILTSGAGQAIVFILAAVAGLASQLPAAVRERAPASRRWGVYYLSGWRPVGGCALWLLPGFAPGYTATSVGKPQWPDG